MGIKHRLYYRAKKRVSDHELDNLLAKTLLEKSAVSNVDIAFLKSALAAKNYLNRASTLLYLGAHKGEFGQALDLVCQFQKVVRIEPNSDLHAYIQKRFSPTKLTIANCAIGAENKRWNSFSTTV